MTKKRKGADGGCSPLKIKVPSNLKVSGEDGSMDKTTMTKKQSWEEQFDEKFPDINYRDKDPKSQEPAHTGGGSGA